MTEEAIGKGKSMEYELIELSNKSIGLQNKNPKGINRRDFFKKIGGISGAGALASFLANCKGSPESPTPNGNASLLIYDFYQNPVTGGSVTTDKGTYGISNGVSDIEQSTSNRCEINVPGNVRIHTPITNGREYILIPSEWERFFAHNNIGGTGTNKFVNSINTYIEGNTNDPDYNLVKERLKVAGSGRANNLVNKKDQANFIIYLNQNEDSHGEEINNGTITKCTIYLQNNTLVTHIDEEIAQGLTHTDDVPLANSPPEASESCIAGRGRGWKTIDKYIMDALYKRNFSKFSGFGYETE